MTPAEIEAWARSVIAVVESRSRVEDDKVELKADWPNDALRAARQLAGCANAAHGSPILWLVGVKEFVGVQPVTPRDLAKWWPEIASKFDGPSPSMKSHIFGHGGLTVTALLFETKGFPYVVQYPANDRVTRELPWREGAATRSATRAELVRMFTKPDQLTTYAAEQFVLQFGLFGLHLTTYLRSRLPEDEFNEVRQQLTDAHAGTLPPPSCVKRIVRALQDAAFVGAAPATRNGQTLTWFQIFMEEVATINVGCGNLLSRYASGVDFRLIKLIDPIKNTSHAISQTMLACLQNAGMMDLYRNGVPDVHTDMWEWFLKAWFDAKIFAAECRSQV